MLKASDLEGSVWLGSTGDMMKVSKEDNAWVARGDSYSIEDKSSKEIQQKLKDNGFEFIGWD